MSWKSVVGLTLLALSVPALGQIIPKDAAEPAEVHKPRGEFAKKLHGGVMPSGKGWKAIMDADRRLQIMLPDKWKASAVNDGDAAIVAFPPSAGKEPTSQFMLTILAPRDADPFDIDEAFALNYADSLAAEPQFKRLKYQPTDSGHVLYRGMKFALAGGRMALESKVATKGKKKEKLSEAFQQEQLIYIASDRLVVMQFTSPIDEFPKHADDLAKVFVSYQNIGQPKVD